MDSVWWLAEVNKHDFHGFYGLGHTCEILRMPFFALHLNRPTSSCELGKEWQAIVGVVS